MIIQSDSVSLSSHRSYEELSTSSQRISAWNNATGQTQDAALFTTSHYYEEGSSGQNQQKGASTTDSSSGSMRDLMDRFRATQKIHGTIVKERLKTIDELRQQSIDYLLYLLFGKKEKAPDFSIYTTKDDASSENETVGTGTGGTYSSYYSYSEKEQTSFLAKGTAVTADGRELSFQINLSMSRAFTQTASTVIDFGEPNLCDPLVIHLSGNVDSISDQKFFFDIDSDGTLDEISTLNPGSGFLALDQNGDGRINDGSELFGTANGNGFADLAAYDSDHNGWIDEADPIFDKLLIWTKDSAGNDKLCAIGKAGVGAIYLGNSDTEFSLKSSANTTNAIVRKTGLFLYENGGCGTIQQMDLAT